nr:ribonuclease H-like domain, reverse transcriptase, RNA-dependent DNA polymerase [Tanacetum cinerariifolium]
MDPGTRLTKVTEGTMVNSTEYRSIIGCLRYLLHTRPDLSYSVGLLSSFMQEPRGQHRKAIRQVLRDSSYGVNTQEGKGTTGVIFYYGELPISWSTQKQATVALSSCETEFIAATAAATQALCFGFHETMVKWIMKAASVLRRGLDEFCLSSGLRPNMPKSTVYFGIPLDANRIIKSDCTGLLDKVRKRVKDWRYKSLSFARRLQLIASVLSSLNVFWASMFILPQGVCEEIDKIFKDFLWKANGKRKIWYSVAWKEVCMQKSEGGLGLKSIHVWNEALIAKHLWNVVISKDSIWDRFILNTKLANLILDGEWRWPNDWNTRFTEIIDIPVSRLIENHNDRVVWINKKGRLKTQDFKMVECSGYEMPILTQRSVWVNSYCSINTSMRNCLNTGLRDSNKVFKVDLWEVCSKDRWPNRTVENSTLKSLGPCKTRWCCSDLVSMLLGFLDGFDLVDFSSGFLSMGMVMSMLNDRNIVWKEGASLVLPTAQVLMTNDRMKDNGMLIFKNYGACTLFPCTWLFLQGFTCEGFLMRQVSEFLLGVSTYGDVLNCIDWSQYGLVIHSMLDIPAIMNSHGTADEIRSVTKISSLHQTES